MVRDYQPQSWCYIMLNPKFFETIEMEMYSKLKKVPFGLFLMLVVFNLNPENLRAKSFGNFHRNHQSSLLADAQNGRILKNYQSEKTIYPASLVKMMVALM